MAKFYSLMSNSLVYKYIKEAVQGIITGSKDGYHMNTKQLCTFQRNLTGRNGPHLKSKE